jgi:MFS family permease
MFSALRQRNFGLLWFGQLISMTGDWVLFIALPFYIFSLTGSALATGVMFMAMTLPRLLFGSLAGVFVDRWDRRRTMIVADLLRAALLLLLLVVRSAEWVWLIYVVAFVESTISQFFNPAKSAIIPRLVGEQDLLAANSLNGLSDALTRLVGPALGGALLGALGLTSVVLTDSISFLVSGLMIALISLPPAQPQPATLAERPSASAAWKAVWREWLAGLKLVKKEYVVAAIFVVLGVATFGDSIITVLLVPLAKEVIRCDALQLGWLMAAQGVGGLIGGLFVGQMSKAMSPRTLIPLGLGVTAAILLVIINFPIYALALVLMGLVGIAVMGWAVSAPTLLQMSVADRYRGRVFGTLNTTTALMSLCGMGLAGALGDLIDIVPILNIAGGLYLLSAIVALAMLRGTKSPQLEVASTPAG